MSCIEDMLQKIRKRFDPTDENLKEMRNELSRIIKNLITMQC